MDRFEYTLLCHQLHLEREKDHVSGINLGHLFSSSSSYPNATAMYIWQFQKIPNKFVSRTLHLSAFHSEFREIGMDDWWLIYEEPKSDGGLSAVIFKHTHSDVLLQIDFDLNVLRILYDMSKPPILQKLLALIKKHEEDAITSKIHVLLNAHGGMDLRSMEVKRPSFHLESNYNDDFAEVHRCIESRLKKKDEKGLVLLHGEPGTGKSYYIRYLSTVIQKKIIFLPPEIAQCITNPDFIPFLIDNPQSVLVIEDAEKLLVHRDQDGNSTVSALLNIADGLLSDYLNIQIICTFNIDLNKIDPALLRKGRLIARYEFGPLEIPKAKALAEKLQLNITIDRPMKLNELYHFRDMEFMQKENEPKIGFGRR